MKTFTNTIASLKLGLWNEHIYKLKDQVTLNHEVITSAVTNFFDQHVNNISNDEHIICMFRIRTTENVILTIGLLQKIGKEDKDYLIDYIESVLEIKSDEYMEEIIQDIIFSFGIRNGMVEKHPIMEHWYTKTQYQNYKHYKIPATMDINRYGMLLLHNLATKTRLVQITSLTLARIIDVQDGYDVQILKNGKVVLSYKDRWQDKNCFRRFRW